MPKQLWSSFSMDFIIKLSTSGYFYFIFIVVDQFFKMAHYIPCNKIIIGKETAGFFIDNIYWYYGLFDDIVLDWRTQFVSKFWKSLFETLKVKIKLSLAFHLQTKRKIERVNQVLKQYLRCTINYQQEN